MGGNFNPTNALAKGFFSLLLITTTLTACNEADEAIPTQASNKLSLSVKVNPSSRAMVQGTTLADGQSVSVNVTASDGSNYDGKTTGYLNVAYTASGEGTQESPQTWVPATNPILLSGTEGKMYVYYPWTDQADYTAIPVDVTTQTDWMYAEDEYTVSDTQANAEIILSHAQTAVSVNVTRDASYTGAGLIEALAVTSEGLASSATLNTRDGTYTNVTGANTPISIIGETFTLDGTTKTSQENAYMLIPASDQAKDFTITATLDGKTYNHTVTMAEAFMTGKVYKVNVNFTNTGLAVSQVSLVDWDETTLPETTFEPKAPVIGTIDLTTASTGVYAVAKNGKGVAYADADESCIAVALIVNDAPTPQRLMIEKYEVDNTSYSTAHNSYESMYKWYWCFAWGGEGTNQTGITDYTAASSVSSSGYIPLIDGTYFDSSATQLGAYTTWTGSYALNDWNGKTNSDVIKTKCLTNGTGGNYFTPMGILLNTFNATGNSENLGETDWYIPACGQLALIHTYTGRYSDYGGNVSGGINDMLTKIGGTTIPNHAHWSSSEYDSDNGWVVTFDYGAVYWDSKEDNYQVRLVRDLK